MFHAFILACSASISSQVDWDTCLVFGDSWGPYRTEENCLIRSRQMVLEAIEGSMNPILMLILNNPPQMYAEGHCVPSADEPV